MEDKLLITKLDASNWSIWHFQMEHLLKAKGLFGYCDGSAVLDESAPAAEQATFRKESQKAFSTLVMAISDPFIYLVTSCITPEEVWNSLKKNFERNNLANKLFLKKKYFRAEMTESTSIHEHIKYMKELTDKLSAIGAPIEEEDQVVTLLGSLPASYSTLVTALEARVDDNLTLEFVQQALVNEEQKKSADGTQSDGRSLKSALVSEETVKKSGMRKRPRCYYCKKIGHISSQCYKKKNQTSSHAKTVDCATDLLFTAVNEQNIVNKCSAVETNEILWLIDSGASSHMVNDKTVLQKYISFDSPELVSLGDGHIVKALGTGDLFVHFHTSSGSDCKFTISNVLFIPQLTNNLFSVKAATKHGHVVLFNDAECWVRCPEGRKVQLGLANGKLYEMRCKVIHDSAAIVHEKEVDMWHKRLGHVNERTLKEMVKNGTVHGLKIPDFKSLSFCEGCVEGKMSRKPFKSSGQIKSTRKLQLIHTDVCGPMQTESLGGKRYFVTFVDDYSRYCEIYFMRHKSEVLEKFKDFVACVTAESGMKICALRSDNGGEYLSSEFKKFLKIKGIKHELTVPYSPQQNGVAERMNRTLVETARAMLSHSSMPKVYWAEAVANAVYTRNRIISKAIFNEKVTPYERYYGRKPSVSHMRVFGCVSYAWVPDISRKKLDKKTETYRFVGYDKKTRGYRLVDPVTKKLVISRDVSFNEDDFGIPRLSVSCTDDKTEDIPVATIKPEEDENEGKLPAATESTDVPDLRRSQREINPPVRYGFDEYADHVKHSALCVNQISEPQTLSEALNSEYSSQWKHAADSEYNSLIENKTWDLVELPPNRQAVGCKWVFKVKHKSDGKVERFKARLVAKGYSQKYGLDYDETFSPVVRFSSIRTLLAFAVDKEMHIHQMDVETAFLNGSLEEEIYMEQPEGYVKPGNENLVCHLKKSLYGLKQSPRCWNKAFSVFLLSNGFVQSDADPCVFVKKEEVSVIIIAVYVDDLILITDCMQRMSEIKKFLSEKFKMKDLGKLHYCLGITVDQKDGFVKIHQEHYIQKILFKYGLAEAKSISTPADINVKLQKEDGTSKNVNGSMYQSMIGSLLYAAIATRPDISQIVGVLSKFNSCSNESHLSAVKRVFRYLKGTMSMGIRYCKSSKWNLVGFSDADWAGNLDDRRSTSGNLFLLSNAPVSWQSKKQSNVTLSTTEAEYVALSSATQELVWLRRLLSDIGEVFQDPTVLYEDNQGAISVANNPIIHARTKHIDIRYHFVREKVEDGTIQLKYCPTDEMIADILTKPLPTQRFVKLRELMGVCH